MSKVALIKGKNRYQNVFSALQEIKGEVKHGIKGKKNILIKPNFVSVSRNLAATRVEVVRAILDFIKPFVDREITIAENPAGAEASQGFEEYGYLHLKNKYNVRLKDLRKDQKKKVEIFSRDLSPLKINVSETVLQSDFRISPARLKTHDSVIATLSLKNMLVGSISPQSRIHQGPKAINKSLAKLADIIPPHLSVIDGWKGMEGEGPVRGKPVTMKVALAGTDFVAVDSVGARLMGFDPQNIGYLYHCAKKGLGEMETEKIEVAGNTSVQKEKRNFKPHSGLKGQLQWR